MPPAWLVDVTNVEFVALAGRGELAALSVKELKSYLYEHEESLSGAKKARRKGWREGGRRGTCSLLTRG